MRQFKRENSIVDCFPKLKRRKSHEPTSPKPKKMGKLLLLEHNKVPVAEGYQQLNEDDDDIVLVISEEGLLELNTTPTMSQKIRGGDGVQLNSTGEEEDDEVGLGQNSCEIQFLRREGEKKNVNLFVTEEVITVETVDMDQQNSLDKLPWQSIDNRFSTTNSLHMLQMGAPSAHEVCTLSYTACTSAGHVPLTRLNVLSTPLESPTWSPTEEDQRYFSSSFYSHAELESSKPFDPFKTYHDQELTHDDSNQHQQCYTTPCYKLPAEMTSEERQQEIDIALIQCQQLLDECARYPDLDFKEPNWWENLLQSPSTRFDPRNKYNRFSTGKRDHIVSVETVPPQIDASTTSSPGNCGFCVFETNVTSKTPSFHEEELEFDDLAASRTKQSVDPPQKYLETDRPGTRLDITEHEINRIQTSDVELNPGPGAGAVSPSEFTKLVSTSDDHLLDGHLLDAYLQDKLQSNEIGSFRVSGVDYAALEPTSVESIVEEPLITPVTNIELGINSDTIISNEPPDKKHDSKDLSVVCVSMSLVSESRDVTVEGPPSKANSGQVSQDESIDASGGNEMEFSIQESVNEMVIAYSEKKKEDIEKSDNLTSGPDDFTRLEESSAISEATICLESIVDFVTKDDPEENDSILSKEEEDQNSIKGENDSRSLSPTCNEEVVECGTAESDGSETPPVKTAIDLDKMISSSKENIGSDSDSSNAGRTSIDVNRFLSASPDDLTESLEVTLESSTSATNASMFVSEKTDTSVTFINSSESSEVTYVGSDSQTSVTENSLSYSEKAGSSESSEIFHQESYTQISSSNTISSRSENTSVDKIDFSISASTSDDQLLQSIPDTPSLRMEEDAAEEWSEEKNASLQYSSSLSSVEKLSEQTSIDIGRLVSNSSDNSEEQLVSTVTIEKTEVIGTSDSSETIESSTESSSLNEKTSIDISRLISSSNDHFFDVDESETSVLNIDGYTNNYSEDLKNDSVEKTVKTESKVKRRSANEYRFRFLEIQHSYENKNERIPAVESEISCTQAEEYTNSNYEVKNNFTDENEIKDQIVEPTEKLPVFEDEISILEVDEYTNANSELIDTSKRLPVIEDEISILEVEEYTNANSELIDTSEKLPVMEDEISILEVEEYTNANSELIDTSERLPVIEDEISILEVEEYTNANSELIDTFDSGKEDNSNILEDIELEKGELKYKNKSEVFVEKSESVRSANTSSEYKESFVSESSRKKEEDLLIEELKNTNLVKSRRKDLLDNIESRSNSKKLSEIGKSSSEIQSFDETYNCYAIKTTPSLMTPSGSSSDSDYVAIDNQTSIKALKADNLVASRTQDLLNRYVQNILSDNPAQTVESNEAEEQEENTNEPDTGNDEEEEDSEPVSIEMRKEALLRQHEKDIALMVSQKRLSSVELHNKKIVASQKETFIRISETDDTREKQILNEEESSTVSVQEVHCESTFTERSVSSSTHDEILGSQMNRYIARTKGEEVQRSSDEEEDEKDGAVDESLYIDQKGVKIERSGGKIEIVKSSEGIGNLKSRFGGTSQWKKTDAESAPSNEVDSTKVKSAFSVFKSQENKKVEQPQFNRPKSKKVRDPKELMEIRKKATYGNEEELPQDGVIKKSVDVKQEAVDTTVKHHALNVYKNLEKKEDTPMPVNKPKTKLLSDVEAQATLEGIRSISSSTSEASDVNETVNDLTVDTVSGYGSAAPCSPSSVLSEDYLSDHKDETNREEMKDASLNIGVEAKLIIDNSDDVTLIECHQEVPAVHVPEVETV